MHVTTKFLVRAQHTCRRRRSGRILLNACAASQTKRSKNSTKSQFQWFSIGVILKDATESFEGFKNTNSRLAEIFPLDDPVGNAYQLISQVCELIRKGHHTGADHQP